MSIREMIARAVVLDWKIVSSMLALSFIVALMIGYATLRHRLIMRLIYDIDDAKSRGDEKTRLSKTDELRSIKKAWFFTVCKAYWQRSKEQKEKPNNLAYR